MASDPAGARLLDMPTLRAIFRGLRSDRSQFTPPASPNPVLTEQVAQPFDTVEMVIDRLAALESRLRETSDRRAVFLTIYGRMTREVQARLQAGAFTHSEWMREYLIAFANYYRRAFLAFEQGRLGRVPTPWRIAFGTAIAGEGLVMQQAFLGMNAHINYDLGLAITDVGIAPHRAEKYVDHQRIDDILASLIDAQQAALAETYAAGVADIDAVFGRLDESLTMVSLQKGREQAWRAAVVRSELAVWPIPELVRRVLSLTATGTAHVIRSPQLDPGLLATLREVESEGPTLGAILDAIDREFEARA